MTVKNGDFDEAAQNVIDLIAEGQSLTDALKSVGISSKAFSRVISRVPELGASYAQAKRIRADLLADMALIYANDLSVNPLHNKNRIDIVKWTAGKHHPQVYGDAINVNVEERVNCVGELTEARLKYKQLVAGLQRGITIEGEAE